MSINDAAIRAKVHTAQCSKDQQAREEARRVVLTYVGDAIVAGDVDRLQTVTSIDTMPPYAVPTSVLQAALDMTTTRQIRRALRQVLVWRGVERYELPAYVWPQQ